MSEGPNYQLQIVRVRHSIMQQEAALFKQTLDKMEAIARIQQAEENETAHIKAIGEYKKQLAELEATHGKFEKQDVAKLAAEVQDS